MSDTKEIKIIAGRHICKKLMDMRMTDVKDNNKVTKCWMIYGVCEKCKTVVLNGIFFTEKKPILNLDFIIRDDLISDDEKGKEM